MTTKTFNNGTEIENYFNQILEQVINNVSKKLLEHMHDILNETVYFPHTNEQYEPLKEKRGFYKGWDIEKTTKYVRTLLFNPNKLSLNIIQGSHVGDWEGDMRAYMPSILNSDRENKKHSYAKGAKYLDDNNEGYWDMFQIQLNQKIREWFDEEFSKYGIRRG